MESKKLYSGYRGLLQVAKRTVDVKDTSKIRRALDLAAEACKDEITITGEPKIIHALSVARIIAGEMGLGLTSIITALLHDSYNKLNINSKDLEKEFGKKSR